MGGGGGSGGGGSGSGGQGGCEQRSEVFVKIKKKWGGGSGGGQGGCERRIEVFVKIQKKLGGGGGVSLAGGSGWGVRVDVNVKIQRFSKIQNLICIQSKTYRIITET